ncbi:MAG: hypothetical protein RL226_2105 [Bacteroidota bacterium]|jgi:hypothetical protein
MHKLVFSLGCLMSVSLAFAQIETPYGMLVERIIVDGDTLAVVNLDAAYIAGPKVFKSAREERQYNRTRARVIKVYPYAKAAGEMMAAYEEEMRNLKTERERRKYLDQAEKELKARFEGEIEDMTVSEGIILIKLIDRETGDTSYELIQELKGSFSAFMWQSLARIFGHNLKDDYDAEGEDWAIEETVREIELGIIDISKKEAKVPKAQARKIKKRLR